MRLLSGRSLVLGVTALLSIRFLLAGRSLTAITFTQSYEAANGIVDPFFPLPANQQVYQYTTNSIYGAPG